MKVVSVILARGGSKKIPNKNIIILNGKPLVSYAIGSSVNSRIDETWVSTDSVAIKKIALEYGANVLDRPSIISGDNAKSDEALLHFADCVEFDVLVFIQPTSPLLLSSDINEGLKLIKDYDSVFTVTREHWIPKWSITGKPIGWDIQNRPMRQDVQETFIENGAFYITTRKQLLHSKLRYGGKIGMFEMPISRSFQIDTPEDLDLVTKLL